MVLDILQHALFRSIPETNHRLSKDGQALCRADEDLCPGHNCCACCAGEAKITCDRCQRVHYCGDAHMIRDGPHNVVCGLLAAVEKAEAIEVSPEEQEKILDDFHLNSKALCSSEGWAAVLPAQYATRAAEAEIKEPEDIARPTKRRRVQAEEPSSEEAQEIAAQHEDDKHASDDSDSDKESDEGDVEVVEDEEEEEAQGEEEGPAAARLLAAVQVAVATSYLSYPATLAHALLAGGGGKGGRGAVAGLVAEVASGGQALVVTVLGAAADAELQHLDVWKVLDGLVPGGIVLQFVGPEVDALRHMQTATISAGVRATFFKGEYSSLVDHVMMAGTPLTSLPPLSTMDAPVKCGSKLQPTDQPTDQPTKQATTTAGGSAGSARPAGCLPAELRALPHVLIGYNLGLTCPDYSWGPTLKALRRVFRTRCDAAKGRDKGSAVVRLPWVQTSNTQVEAQMEEDLVLRSGWGCAVPHTRNPWGSMEPLQSGTLANDVYRKSAWYATYELMARVSCGGGRGRRGDSLKQKLGGWAHALGKRVAVATGKLLGKRQR